MRESSCVRWISPTCKKRFYVAIHALCVLQWSNVPTAHVMTSKWRFFLWWFAFSGRENMHLQIWLHKKTCLLSCAMESVLGLHGQIVLLLFPSKESRCIYPFTVMLFKSSSGSDNHNIDNSVQKRRNFFHYVMEYLHIHQVTLQFKFS